MPVPQNAQAIWTFLTGQGFTANAAAGIEGNIEQESGGSPTAGSNPPGAGLIQILGDAGGSLTSELQKTMAYIDANGSVADINANSPNPTAAALFFSTKYERPNPSQANNANREQSAVDTANAAASGNWPQGASTTAATGILPNPLSALDPTTWIGDIKGAIDTGATNIFKKYETDVQNGIMRFGLILLGGLVIIIGIMVLLHKGDGNSNDQAKGMMQQLMANDSAAETAEVSEGAEVAAVAA